VTTIIRPLPLQDVKLITIPRDFDERGFFSETYHRERLRQLGIDADFVQDNHSFSSAKCVVRGLHFQTHPHAQGKLVRVTRGAILDVAVDIRSGSPTFGRHVSAVLSADDWTQLWIPVGFAHGFCTLEQDTEVLYKVTAHYAPACSRGIRWDDPALGISWPVRPDQAIVSEADRKQPLLSQLQPVFRFSDGPSSQPK
jgi:dTDP-4-dehydrorhamnose 3,5-epimerase